MAKYSTFPQLIEDIKKVSISRLREWGYLKEGLKGGKITWSINGNETGSISISVFIDPKGNSYLTLNYNYQDEPIKYQVSIVSVSSNLGIGRRYYFVCPSTGLRCSKLYLSGKYFLHRKTLQGVMYEKQTQSKRSRGFFKCFDSLYDFDESDYKPNLKKHYRGKITKTYQRIIDRENKRARGVLRSDFERYCLR